MIAGAGAGIPDYIGVKLIFVLLVVVLGPVFFFSATQAEDGGGLYEPRRGGVLARWRRRTHVHLKPPKGLALWRLAS
jgi:hypothetical protein